MIPEFTLEGIAAVKNQMKKDEKAMAKMADEANFQEDNNAGETDTTDEANVQKRATQ